MDSLERVFEDAVLEVNMSSKAGSWVLVVLCAVLMVLCRAFLSAAPLPHQDVCQDTLSGAEAVGHEQLDFS